MKPMPLFLILSALLVVCTAGVFSPNAAGAHSMKNRAGALLSMPKNSRTLSRARSSLRSWTRPSHIDAPPSWAPIYPIDFGADPSGVSDSSAAFDLAMAELFSRGTSGHFDESGTIDLGGATLDLQGGDYLISKSLFFPSNYSNYGLIHGTLRANINTFNRNDFLVDIGTPGGYCINWGNSCTENVNLEDLFLDATAIANGVRFTAVIGVNAGPDIFIVNFTQVGVDMEAGHEVELHESWIGSCWYTPPSACWLNASALNDTVGILINGNDHLLNQVVVFAARSGIIVNGAANILTSCHTWNTQEESVSDAVGIQVNSWQNRLVAPYLDYVPLVLKGAAMTSITNGFFLDGAAKIVFLPDPNNYPVQGIYISGSEFAGGGDVFAIGTGFTGLQDVTIVGSLHDDAAAHRSTTASRTLINVSSPWVFDFTDNLVFDASVSVLGIKTVSCSFITSAGFFRWNILTPVGAVVTVISDTPVTATATCTVDQSLRT